MNIHDIIQMLDNRCINLIKQILESDNDKQTLILCGKLAAYEELLDHIHLGIEKELNALENQTGE